MGPERGSAGAPSGPGRAVWLLGGLAAAILAGDVVTKQVALAQLADEVPVRLWGGVLYLSLTRNSGAAFSLGGDYTWIFPIFAVIMIGFLVWLARGVRSLPWAVSLGLILGGVLGNLTDRVFRAPGVFRGHVVDMVSLFDPYGRIWPVFNLADSALVCGVVLAVFLEFTGRPRDGSRRGDTTEVQA
ncbi:hypothetical protein GCM10010124_18140 [Pilimelia terevasa]|uniref:Lipoprotein signal peptidase n=1 Tax=Pilimelia terevasa TaxID=53372 RepID=A0A8J3FGS5_9ACTN|nr:signal peptidase II [Pilimelia terevasa]GGK25972.1 hypothetical protein GCM10010124_18140 [Pilimelia terevasa]